MAAKQTNQDLINIGQVNDSVERSQHQPADLATPSSQNSTVSHDLFTLKSQQTAVELALHELLSTIKEAEEVRQQPNPRQRLLQSHIAALQEDVEMVASFEVTDEKMQMNITRAVLQARKVRRQLERDVIDKEIELEATSRHEHQQVQLIQLDSNKATGMKLAPLKPPTFAGDATQFSIYREFFEENVLNSEHLTDTAKWLRLTESLSGTPAELISELPQTPRTLTVAWKLLVDTFSSDDTPIVALYGKLQQLPQASMMTASLKMTHSKLEGILLTLEHLGHDVGETGYVRWIYMNKFPMEVAYQVQKKRNMPLAELRTAVNDFIRAREGADQQAGQYTFDLPQATARKATVRSAIEVAATKRGTPTNARACTFCSADHWNDSCTTYQTIEARKQKLAGKCFKCFRRMHDGNCINPRRCFHCDSMEHNRALCPTKFPETSASKQPTVQAAVVTEEASGVTGYFLAFVVQASSAAVQEPIHIRAVVDTGGGATVLRREVAEQLQIPIQKTASTVYTGLGGSQLIRSQPMQAPLYLESRNGTKVEIQAEVVDWIIPEIPTADVDRFRQQNPQFNEVYIPPTGHGRPVDLLIGSDMVVEFLSPQPIQKVNEDISLLPTVFGSLIFGRTSGQRNKVYSNLLFNPQTNPIAQMCNLDLIGLTDLHNNDIDEEERAIQNFYDTVRYIDKRYSISWPWRSTPPNLDTNFGLALGRLRTLHRKLKNSPHLLLDYHKIILRQLETNIIEEVDRKTSASVVHYVPHHPVLQAEKEIRPVYDGSSRAGKAKRSLNDNILKGKNWLNDLFKTLPRFRRYRSVVSSDIAKAFHQIMINEDDRDAVRFIWLRDPLEPPTDENLRIYRFRRVAFGIVASPFILSATIRYHASKQEPCQSLSVVLQDMYADNLVASLPDTVNLEEFYEYTKNFFATMSMDLTKWATNSHQLRAHIPETDQSKDNMQSILGLKWNVQSDTFRFKPPKIQQIKTLTRRGVAREMASYFDPMGWATPVLLLAKNFFRKLWAETGSWDEALRAVHIQEWTEISERLKHINSIELPRQLQIFDGQQDFQLHTFVDASAAAYAVVVYLRVQQGEKVKLSMVAAKSRLTPLKAVTIPKLEFIAIVLGCRFTHFVREALQFSQVTTFIWSDSKCALSWVRQGKILLTAIEKQITEIKTCRIDNFRYVPGEKNFADVATRGADVHTLLQMAWWKGPEWLYHEEDWPIITEPVEIDPSIALMFHTKVTLKVQRHTEEEITGIGGVQIKEFSSLAKLLVRTAYVLTAVTRLLKNNFLNLQNSLDTATALKFWLRWDQGRCYALPNEPEAGKQFPLRNIAVFRDQDGILRCQTRLRNSFFEIDTVTPILLVKNSTLTKLIVLQLHKQLMHAGTNHTLAAVRQRYWLPHGRRQVYKIIVNECFVCRKNNAKTYPTPPPAPLPEFRILRVQRPFQAVGVDVFGPFLIRRMSQVNAVKEKRWTLIFTCATVRAVHLEILTEMTTLEISYAFRRFFARKGVPRKIISDNAPQFHVLDNHFRNLWQTLAAAPSISSYFAERQIEWEFTPELAPWMGGIYERLIQSIKKAFEKTYADKVLTNKQFELAMVETEAVINSRPIAYVDRDPECPILTPNDFLSAKFSAVPIKQTVEEKEDILAKLWKSSQAYLDQFWSTWASQYIMLLRERNDQLVQKRSHAKNPPEKGDIVVMQDLTKKRSTWQLAVIERLVKGNDGEIRTAQIRIPGGARLIRPVILLAPLGIKMDLPNVRDDQLNKKRDAIVIWPLDDNLTEETTLTHLNSNEDQVIPPRTCPSVDNSSSDAAENNDQA